jgi:hypothetical protein
MLTREKRKFEMRGMLFLRTVAGYRMMNHKRNEGIREMEIFQGYRSRKYMVTYYENAI